MGVRKKVTDSKKRLPGSQVRSDSYELSHGFNLSSEDVELDVIERLKSNILMLDDLQQRLSFMNSELESVLGSRFKPSSQS